MPSPRAPSEARPGAEKSRSGAPGGALSPKGEGDAPRKRVTGGFAGHPRSAIASAPRFPALRSP